MTETYLATQGSTVWGEPKPSPTPTLHQLRQLDVQRFYFDQAIQLICNGR